MKVFLVFQDGQEDPFCVCSGEDVALQAIAQIKAKDQFENGLVKDTWYESYDLLTNNLEVIGYFK